MRFLAPTVGLLLALSISGPASAQTAAWLDAPPRTWNQAAAPLPPAPQASAANTDRCTSQERAPVGAEESALAAAGWRLTTYWPAVRSGDVAVVAATAGYDGMCRPIGYQALVFAGGRYAGTLSPEPMASRTDGALTSAPDGPAVTVAGDRIEARFVRYRPSDPLCCPTGGHARVSYALQRGAAGPVVAATAIQAEPAAAPAAPSQLPRTGGPALVPLLALGALLTLLGAALRPLGYIHPGDDRTAGARGWRARPPAR
jgi:hypothetical protein